MENEYNKSMVANIEMLNGGTTNYMDSLKSSMIRKPIECTLEERITMEKIKRGLDHGKGKRKKKPKKKNKKVYGKNK